MNPLAIHDLDETHEQYLNQFLRIKTAGEMLGGNQVQNRTKTLREQLSSGENLEVGGYCLSATLAHDLTQLKLHAFSPRCPVTWLEVGNEQPGPASLRVIDAWRQAGVSVQAHSVAGDAFWLTQEITECTALLASTSP